MPDNGPKIQPGVVQVAGEGLSLVADNNPELFPLGLEVVVMVPGQLQPLGSIAIPRGCMLAIVPPGMSKQLRGEIHKVMAARQKAAAAGRVKAPGVQ